MNRIVCLLSVLCALVVIPVGAGNLMSISGDVIYFSKSVKAFEVDEGEGGHGSRGEGSAQISKTDSKGNTKVVYVYKTDLGESRTVVFNGPFYARNFEFEYNGVVYNHSVDGCTCTKYYPEGHGELYFDDGSNLRFFVFPWVTSGGDNQTNVNVPESWRKARTLTGLYGEGCGGVPSGTCSLKCGKANRQGIAKVSLTITPFMGKKISYRAVSVNVADGTATVNWDGYTVTIKEDGSFFGEPNYTGARPACSPNAVWNAKLGGLFQQTAIFDFGFLPETIDGYVVSYPRDGEPVFMNGAKWAFEKVARMRWVKCPPNAFCGPGTWNVDTTGGKTNISGLKLNYNAKTGVFKGTFRVYMWAPGGKKYTVSVFGVVEDGQAYGKALLKNPAMSWDISF